MAKKLRIELNSAGVRELLKSPEIMQACRTQAQRIAGRAGDGYEISEYTGKKRVNVSVHAASEKAYKDNLKNNTLLKAVGK